MLHQLCPGVSAWATKDIKAFRAFALHQDDEVVLIDPLPTDEAEIGQIRALGRVLAILLTTPWHERDAAAAARTWGAPVYAHPDALKHLAPAVGAKPLPIHLPFDLIALPVPDAQPGHVAYYCSRDGGSLFPGDLWHNEVFARFPWYMRPVLKYVFRLRDGLNPLPPSKARNPDGVHQRLLLQLDEYPLKRLFVAHGACLVDGAETRMRNRLAKGP